MNDKLENRSLKDLLKSSSAAKVNSHGQEPLEPVPSDPDDATEASDRCGRSSSRGLFQGFILELENGNREGIMYGAVLGRFRFNPSVGISFVCEDAEGMWKVSIEGRELHNLHRELTLGRRESIRCGENVTAISVTAWKPK